MHLSRKRRLENTPPFSWRAALGFDNSILVPTYIFSRPIKAVTLFSGAIISVSISESPILLHGSRRKNSFCSSSGTSPYPGLNRGWARILRFSAFSRISEFTKSTRLSTNIAPQPCITAASALPESCARRIIVSTCAPTVAASSTTALQLCRFRIKSFEQNETSAKEIIFFPPKERLYSAYTACGARIVCIFRQQLQISSETFFSGGELFLYPR